VTERGPAIYWQEDMEQYAFQKPWNSVQIPWELFLLERVEAAIGY